MKMLKKGTAVLFVMVMAMMLVACGGEEETKTYELSKNSTESKLTYTCKGDNVIKQTDEYTMPYTALGVSSKAEAEKFFKEIIDKLQNIDGLTVKVEYKDDKAIETLEIDYTKISSENIKGIPGLTMSGDISKGISMRASEKLLKARGYKEVK
ncbi:YehR family lipoprotein [Listeria monocytogenes]|nr:YehR family lipoprotein [Listeria monocytogenes]